MQDAYCGDVETDVHLAEICELLALGLMRLKARQSSGKSALSGEFCLDCVADQSGGANHSRRSEGQGGEGANSEKRQGKIKGYHTVRSKSRRNARRPVKGQGTEAAHSSAAREEHEGGTCADLRA